MPGTQTRSPKTKATPKMTGRGVTVARKSKRGNSEARPAAGSALSAQERQMLVARAAYFRAEKRGFAPGGELQDWVEAEAEVLRLIGGA
jgi:hypothetical protein